MNMQYEDWYVSNFLYLQFLNAIVASYADHLAQQLGSLHQTVETLYW